MTPIEWLLSDDTGTSSKTILSVMTGSKMTGTRADVPYDGGDFGRCYRLLKEFPEWKTRLHEVAEKYVEWVAIVREWDRLSAEYEKDEKVYEILEPLVEEGRFAAGWRKEGCSWYKDNRTEMKLNKNTSITF
jgi:hypothetical protein